jgi:hypothetical protein
MTAIITIIIIIILGVIIAYHFIINKEKGWETLSPTF